MNENYTIHITILLDNKYIQGSKNQTGRSNHLNRPLDLCATKISDPIIGVESDFFNFILLSKFNR